MYTTTLRRIDGAFSIDVPEQVVSENHLSPGVQVGVVLQTHVSTGVSGRKRYSAEQLALEHAEIIDQLDDNREWIDAPAVGRELISSGEISTSYPSTLPSDTSSRARVLSSSSLRTL